LQESSAINAIAFDCNAFYGESFVDELR